MLVPFLTVPMLSTAAPHPRRSFLDYITGNLAVTVDGFRSPRTLSGRRRDGPC
ncbi:hypothetical protein [Streptomyces niveus]|uniref:hypothetical protein n=1 Tax=Streptomyces niveus TaxID=193462 RepID=UPI0034501B83